MIIFKIAISKHENNILIVWKTKVDSVTKTHGTLFDGKNPSTRIGNEFIISADGEEAERISVAALNTSNFFVVWSYSIYSRSNKPSGIWGKVMADGNLNFSNGAG